MTLNFEWGFGSVTTFLCSREEVAAGFFPKQ